MLIWTVTRFWTPFVPAVLITESFDRATEVPDAPSKTKKGAPHMIPARYHNRTEIMADVDRALSEVITVITGDQVPNAKETCRDGCGNSDSDDRGHAHERRRSRRRKFGRALASDQSRSQLQSCPQCISTWAGFS